jgi:2,4-dienoyl-CoA reductase-like NADH-dependent reductase (Old Yellow Enzyme family)
MEGLLFMSAFDPLFQPIELPNGVRLESRLAIAPMTTWSGNVNGTVSDQEIAYYERRARLSSLFISACIAVSPTGVTFDRQFIAFDDVVLPRLKKMAEAMKSGGAKAILQIHHGGSEAKKEWTLFGQTLSASAVPSYSDPNQVPEAMTEEQVEIVIKEYGLATRQAIRAGFDGVEIHGANHYLIQQFVSAHFNKRTDEWGGSLEKRLRFPFAILDEVISIAQKYADDSFIIGYRFSPEEMFHDKGYDLQDTLKLVDGLIEHGVHYLHVSQGNIKALPHGNQSGDHTIVRQLSAHIHGRVPLIAVGGIHFPDQAVSGLRDGADLIALGREAIMDPDWTEKVRTGKIDQIKSVLDLSGQHELVVPDRLWSIITTRSGWFPIEKK